MKKLFFIVLIIMILFCVTGLKPPSDISWEKIDDGLYLSEYSSPLKSSIGDSKITILKIDPHKYTFNLFSAKEKGEYGRTAKEWAEQKNQIAVINAGMYLSDGVTNVGYMKDYDFINNSTLNKNNAILAFNRKDESVPNIQIIDRKCQVWDNLKSKYNSFTQSIRMVDCNQRNCWTQQDKMWSMVIIGMDKNGNVLFIFSRSPYSVHDFIDILLKSPLGLYNAMYLEGGPPASFYLNYNAIKVEKMGGFESGYYPSDENHVFWMLPNVIGIEKM